MCDGQVANDCDIISLVKYESMLKEQMKIVDDEFKEITVEINEVLNAKKKSLIERYRKDPRIQNDGLKNMKKIIKNSINQEEFARLEIAETITDTPKIDSKRILQCKMFSDKYLNVFISRNQRSLYYMGAYQDEIEWGYAFLKHPKKGNNKVLKWTLRVPKFNYPIGMVTQTLFINDV